MFSMIERLYMTILELENDQNLYINDEILEISCFNVGMVISLNNEIIEYSELENILSNHFELEIK